MKALIAILLSTTVQAQTIEWDSPDQSELSCLAMNIYHEARSDGIDGMTAVGHVTMNRVGHASYPSDVCDVVYEPYQFSWTNELDTRPTGWDVRMAAQHRPNEHDVQSWGYAIDIAHAVYYNTIPSNVGEALFFHEKSILPDWASQLSAAFSIGSHIYY